MSILSKLAKTVIWLCVFPFFLLSSTVIAFAQGIVLGLQAFVENLIYSVHMWRAYLYDIWH